ncbi:MAG TPA: aldehyde dehydrogenase EutE, partial [Tepidisphaeraceae bacterium]|nr:aldehyde dehydrogenase EutE [Tepidisphaeraceae bacterium]
HRDIPLLVVTGGAAVARAALHARKRAIVAGPGNPPVVVDETACLSNAAESIIKGGAYDNNLLCIGEKEVFCVESVFDKLLAQMEKHGGFPLNDQQIARLTQAAFKPDKEGHPHVNKDFVGKDPSVLAEAAGVRIPPQTQILFGVTDNDHPFVQEEQMMPFIPFVRVKNVDEAIELALKAEHGYRHTAIIHSRNVDAITRFGRLAATTIFVANGSCLAGLGGAGGEGYGSYSIATPTGEGITTPLTFTRFRRVTISGALRMI